MYVPELLAIISCLWVGVQSGDRQCREVVIPRASFLEITDNSVVKRGPYVRSGWYRTVNWPNDYDGDLKLTVHRYAVARHGGREEWTSRYEKTDSICNLHIRQEFGSWAAIVRESIGIPEACPVKKGQRNLYGAMFASVPCRNVDLTPDPLRESVGEHWIQLTLHDDSGTKLLDGYLQMY